jgi:hypothetical protein
MEKVIGVLARKPPRVDDTFTVLVMPAVKNGPSTSGVTPAAAGETTMTGLGPTVYVARLGVTG